MKGTELTLELIHSQMKPNQRQTVDENTLKEIHKLAEDPDYGEEFLHTYLDHLNIFKELPGRSHTQFLSAIKFFSLIEADHSLVDAYIKVFPERFTQRNANTSQEQSGKELLRGEASRYNKSLLVSEIRRVATIPIQIIYRHVLHEAIMNQAELMRSAKSEMVRQKAGATLITELKPAEEQILSVKVEDGSKSAIEELRLAAEALAIAQQQSVNAGVPLNDISATKIYTSYEDITDVIENEEVNEPEEETSDDKEYKWKL